MGHVERMLAIDHNRTPHFHTESGIMPQPQWFYQPQTSMGSGETVGPLSHEEFTQKVLSGKLKKNDLVSSQATEGKWYAAADVPYIKKVWQQQKAEADQQKQAARQRRSEQKKQNAERRSESAKQRQERSSAFREKLLGAKDSPESFVATCDAFIRGIRIIGWGSVSLAVLVQIAMIAVNSMVADDTAEALQAVITGGIVGFFAIVIQLIIAYILIEASVLSLRFMKIVVVLLNQPSKVKRAQRVEA